MSQWSNTLETLEHSTAHQEQTQLFSAPIKDSTHDRGSQHLTSLVLMNNTRPGTTTPNAHQCFTCPICMCRLLQWQLLHSWPMSQLQTSWTKFGSTSKKCTTQCNNVVPGEASRPTFLHVLSWKLHWGPRSDIGHRCPHVQPKRHTCNSAIILSPSSSSSSFAAVATACPVLWDNAWSSLGALDCAVCPASSLHSYKGMRKQTDNTAEPSWCKVNTKNATLLQLLSCKVPLPATSSVQKQPILLMWLHVHRLQGCLNWTSHHLLPQNRWGKQAQRN